MKAEYRPENFILLLAFLFCCPLGGDCLGKVAGIIVHNILFGQVAPKKLLVSDLDNVLWSGVVAEDGPHALEFGPADIISSFCLSNFS